jgi:HPt (histidine-containing phosphotransfer) domain-containing protein
MESAIDPTRFAELRDTTGGEFVAELIEAFLQEGPGMLEELRSALLDGSADRFRRAAHSLKSNGHALGAMTLGAMARDLELSGLDPNAARDEARLLALEAEFARAGAELRELRHG